MKWEIPAQSTELNLCYLLWKSAQLQAEKPTKARSYRLRKLKHTLSIFFCFVPGISRGMVLQAAGSRGEVRHSQLGGAEVLCRLWVEHTALSWERNFSACAEMGRGDTGIAAGEGVGLISLTLHGHQWNNTIKCPIVFSGFFKWKCLCACSGYSTVVGSLISMTQFMSPCWMARTHSYCCHLQDPAHWRSRCCKSKKQSWKDAVISLSSTIDFFQAPAKNLQFCAGVREVTVSWLCLSVKEGIFCSCCLKLFPWKLLCQKDTFALPMNKNNQPFCGRSSLQITLVVPKKQTLLPNTCSGERNIQVTARLGLQCCLFPLFSLLYCELLIHRGYLLRRMPRETSNSVIPESNLGRRREQQVTGWSGWILSLAVVRNSFGKLSLLLSQVAYCRALCGCRFLQ